jgi:hypothetical protein
MNPEIAEAIELLVQAVEQTVDIPENQKYRDAAATVEAYLATHDPRR